MSVWAYLRVSTDSQDLTNQRLTILDWANSRGLKVDNWIEIAISSRKTTRERRIDELMANLQKGDILIVSELSRLGRSIAEIITIVNELVAKEIDLILVKQNLELRSGKQDMGTKIMVTIFGLLAESERDLISERTKMALARVKAQGRKLGRPKGRIGRSKLDGKEKEIQELLAKRVPKSVIARILGCSRSCVINFIKSRKLA